LLVSCCRRVLGQVRCGFRRLSSRRRHFPFRKSVYLGSGDAFRLYSFFYADDRAIVAFEQTPCRDFGVWLTYVHLSVVTWAFQVSRSFSESTFCSNWCSCLALSTVMVRVIEAPSVVLGMNMSTVSLSLLNSTITKLLSPFWKNLVYGELSLSTFYETGGD